ncbi:glyoxalase/bleomycin resistance protein/dioxygenase [Pandoraea horticolens]|uniref:Glyoxalase/bleomycin resistance protein/dioxygenase n=1 Tax=Pandoraea horticolens TaxID=2508298 RepID=A0A5E4RRH8_9BURK|nr:VOC family protein [Pandoraea horticolens]VVD64659.1 glyoxalase/bleomycin resistance protein/dioxygenase [Pandoraea horticolens]
MTLPEETLLRADLANINNLPMRQPRVQRTHLSLFVRDPIQSGKWYADVLGMTQTARAEQWVFMSFGQKHHDIALIRAVSDAEIGTIGLQHYGLEIAGDLRELRRLYGMLIRRKVPIVKITDHKVGIGVYFNDPDGNRLEFFCETVTDDEEGKRVLNEYNAPSDPTQLEPIFD